MVSVDIPTPRRDAFRSYALLALLAAFAWRCRDMLLVLKTQPSGVDYAAFWAGVHAAAAGRLYDFAYVTGLQGWPLGPDELRPFIYPPSSLLAFAPFAALPLDASYMTWTAVTFALYACAAWRIGSPWWIALFPAVWLVGITGQAGFLVGGLGALALTLRGRPVAVGVLLGLAALVKPQLLVFAPVALVAARQWRSLVAAGLTGLAGVAASAVIFGPHLWLAWFGALHRFQAEVVLPDPKLVQDAITPFATLRLLGLPGALAFALFAPALALVWRTFRTETSAADRLIVLFGAALLVSPSAMHYEAALLAPGVAAYLARTTDRLWPLYATAAVAFTVGLIFNCAPIAAALVLPAATWMRRSPRVRAYARRLTAKSARSCSGGLQLLEP